MNDVELSSTEGTKVAVKSNNEIVLVSKEDKAVESRKYRITLYSDKTQSSITTNCDSSEGCSTVWNMENGIKK